MLTWFAFFMLLIGGLFYGFLSPDFWDADKHNLPYARAAIMPLVIQHQGAVKLISLNLPEAKTQLGLTDTQFINKELYGNNLFSVPAITTASVGIISAQKLKTLLPAGMEKNFKNFTTLTLPTRHNYITVFACLDETTRITTECAQNDAYVLTYGYQQDWWDDRATKKDLWQKALHQETNGKMCGVLSCTPTNCQIVSGGVSTPFPTAFSGFLVSNALVNTGKAIPLNGLMVCLTQVSVGPGDPSFVEGSSVPDIKCLQNTDCTLDGRTYCNPKTFKCEAVPSNEECAAVNGSKPYYLPGYGCVACIADEQCSDTTPICNTDNYSCVQCLQDADCPVAKPHCNTTAHTCGV